MTKKCIVLNCRSNYEPPKSKKRGHDDANKENRVETKEHVPVFRIPSDPEERKRWVDTLPVKNKEEVMEMKEPVVCIKH